MSESDRVSGELTLFSRAGCHLCDDMLDDLEEACRGYPVRLTVVDVDTDATLAERYGERVPVLCDGQQELCAVRLDASTLAPYLRNL